MGAPVAWRVGPSLADRYELHRLVRTSVSTRHLPVGRPAVGLYPPHAYPNAPVSVGIADSAWLQGVADGSLKQW